MITFFNVKSRERRTVDTEPLIAAFYNSSNLHENARLGQDHGWRLAPEIVVRLNKLQSNPTKMAEIASLFNLPQGEVKETDLLRYISIQDAAVDAPQATDEDFTREYEDEIRKLEAKDAKPKAKAGAKDKSKDEPKEEDIDPGDADLGTDEDETTV